MKNLILTICSLLVLAACSNSENQKDSELIDEYKLIEIDSYSFRRAYHGHDTLKAGDLDLFMNRNPEPNENYTNSESHSFYKQLTEIGLFQHGNLNINEVDTLPNQFNYQLSPNKFFKVKTRLLEDPKEVETPSYELTFNDLNKIVLIDTLKFDWPPDVTFFKTDLDKDGVEELLSIFRWYIVNGDNFDLKVYKLRKVPSNK
jgi:SET domain-containing protein